MSASLVKLNVQRILLFLCAMACAGPAFATVIANGQATFLEEAPPSVRKAANLDGPEIFTFIERGTRLSSDLPVDVLGERLPLLGLSGEGNYLINGMDDVDLLSGSVPAFTPFTSVFAHIDSVNDNGPNGFSGSLTFNRDILGVILSHGRGDGSGNTLTRLGDTDAILGSPTTLYPTQSARDTTDTDFDLRRRNGDFENGGDGGSFDRIRISHDQRTLIMEASNIAQLDQLRVLVANGEIVIEDVVTVTTDPIFIPQLRITSIDPQDPPEELSENQVAAALSSAVQGQTFEISRSTNDIFIETFDNIVSGFETPGIPGVDYGFGDPIDPDTFYALTMDDVPVTRFQHIFNQNIFARLTSIFQLELPIGDYNKDGTVDAADYTVWRDTEGSSVAFPFDGADGDGNGIVDGADLQVWRDRFGDRAIEIIAETSSAVPEPSTVAFVVAAACLARLPRQRRGR
ncbi:MAG: hypothetical protein AAF266_05570 [Planctomycetota bacterium]